MFFGRAGAIYNHTRWWQKENAFWWIYEPDDSKPSSTLVTEYKETKCISRDKLEFRKLPILIWSISLVVISFGIFLFYHFTFGSFIFVYDEHLEGQIRIGTVLEYFCCLAVIALGILFLSVATIETSTFDWKSGFLFVRKTTLGWGTFQDRYPLEEVKDVYVVKKGFVNLNNDTTHFKVVIEFSNDKRVKIQETNYFWKAKTIAFSIQTFLGFENAKYREVEIRDETGR